MKTALVLAMLLVASVSLADTIMPATVTVPATGSAVVRLANRAAHVRLKTAVDNQTVRFYEVRVNSSGVVVGAFASCPPDTVEDAYLSFDNHMVPASGDTVLALDQESVTAWNVYNNIVADIIVLHNANGTPSSVELEGWR